MNDTEKMVEGTNLKLVTPAKRGFAAMSPERLREIASKGGQNVPASKRAYSLDKDLASRAGVLGGKSVDAKKRAFSKDRKLAVRAGLESAKVRRKAK